MNAVTAEIPTTWFQLTNTDDLRKLGVAGESVWARVYEGTLELCGAEGSVLKDGVTVLDFEKGGVLRIAAAEVTRMRFSYSESRYGRYYETKLWRVGAVEPLQLPHWAFDIAYTQAMHGFAALLAGQATPARIEGGDTKFGAILGPVLMAIPLLMMVLPALFVLTSTPWWGRLIMVLVPSVAFAFFLRYSVKRHWPRVITNLDDLYLWLPLLPVDDPPKSATRWGGAALLVIGLFLIGMMVALVYYLSTLPPPSGASIEGAGAAATSTKNWVGRIIGSLVAIFGVMGMLAGLHMIITGRRDKRWAYALLGIVVLLFVIVPLGLSLFD